MVDVARFQESGDVALHVSATWLATSWAVAVVKSSVGVTVVGPSLLLQAFKRRPDATRTNRDTACLIRLDFMMFSPDQSAPGGPPRSAPDFPVVVPDAAV